MGEIERKDYETITARCDECGSLSVLNRVDDIGDPGPYYSGCYVGCTECGTPFWVFGDAIEPAYELLLLDAEEHMRAKQYMLCVMSLAQAWEMFFATFAYSHYLYRPFHRNARYPGRTERFDGLAKQLGDAIWNFTFHPLRNVLLNTVVEGVRPRTLDESEIAIARIRGDNFDQRPNRGLVQGEGSVGGAHIRRVAGGLALDVTDRAGIAVPSLRWCQKACQECPTRKLYDPDSCGLQVISEWWDPD